MNDVTKQAIQATLHCLLGCAIGEILGMVIGNAMGLHGALTVILSIVLAFFFGYLLTIWSLRRSGLSFKQVIVTALASDTISITSMEIIDNLIIILIPGAMAAGLTSGLFWGSLAAALAIAFIITVPVNRFLINRGRGHAVIHQYHNGHSHHH